MLLSKVQIGRKRASTPKGKVSSPPPPFLDSLLLTFSLLKFKTRSLYVVDDFFTMQDLSNCFCNYIIAICHHMHEEITTLINVLWSSALMSTFCCTLCDRKYMNHKAHAVILTQIICGQTHKLSSCCGNGLLTICTIKPFSFHSDIY